MKSAVNKQKTGGALDASPVPNRIAAKTSAASRTPRDKAEPRTRKQAIRNLDGGLPPFSTIREFAAFTHVHPRTIARDVEDGLLIANEFRGARRISREDGLAYLRKTRSNVGGKQRRRSPRKPSVKAIKSTQEML